MRKNVLRGIIIRNTDSNAQVLEVLDRLQLHARCDPFSRCIDCNGLMRRVLPEDEEFGEIRNDIPPGVLSWCREYYRCGSCGKVYWKGGHYDKLKHMVDSIMHRKENKDD